MKMTGLLISTLVLTACGPSASDFVIINGTSEPVEAVTFIASGETWDLGDIDAGHQVKFAEWVEGEGKPTVSWSWKGRRYYDMTCHYSAGLMDGSGAKGKVVIRGDRLETVDCQLSFSE